MAKHNLEVEPEEGYELVQVISEERGKRKCSFFSIKRFLHMCSILIIHTLHQR